MVKPKDNFSGFLMVKCMNFGHEKLSKWARSFLKINKNYVILDLGCGGGRNVKYFLTKANKVYGMDYSKTSVEISKNLNKKAIKENRCEIIEGNVKNIPFKDKTVNIITAF